MKILLLGEYSNVHNTLAQGLRQLGHEVTVASGGDFWKNYPRDIDLARRPGKLGGVRLLAKVYSLLPRWRGYDVVQLINPIFIDLKAERLLPIYRYLRRHNKAMVLGAMGMDWYWVHESTYRKPMRYSDFNIGDKVRTDAPAVKEQHDWLDTPKGELNKYIANDCDGIVSVLYDDHVCYEPYFPKKLQFIPLPIQSTTLHHTPFNTQPPTLSEEDSSPLSNKKTPLPSEEDSSPLSNKKTPLHLGKATGRRVSGNGVGGGPLGGPLVAPLKVFIGISKGRSAYKGTDIMLQAAEDVKKKYPERMELVKAEGVPFDEYQQMMDNSDVLLDQLYSYTPAMNALLAMSKGIIVVGGGEPENYDILHETELRPIINVLPTYDSVYHELEQLVLHPERIQTLKQQSIEYVKRHHDYIKIARQYEAFYRKVATR